MATSATTSFAGGATLGLDFTKKYPVDVSVHVAGGGVVQKNNAEYIVRGVGWIRDKHDIENTVVKEINGIPIYVKTIATVQLGTQFRRSVYEKDGNEVTGGAVLMRHGENPLAVTERVKAKIQELQPGLPEGVHIVPAYDRTRLIQVMTNLISNATKFNRPGGEVHVDLCEGGDGEVCVEVRDTGLGMSPAQLAQLFQPFNRLGRERQGIPGTGIFYTSRHGHHTGVHSSSR